MWAIRHCKLQAAEIMDAGRARIYPHAIKWLAKARNAYFAADKEAEWQSCLSQFIKDTSGNIN
jgi:uncharacterized Zn finger protein